jgi:hypothetical protein
MGADQSVMAKHHVEVAGEPRWRRRLRLMQALWREEQGLPIGTHPGRDGKARSLGSRIAMPAAEQNLSNYLTDTVREVVRAEVDRDSEKLGKVYKKPRIFDDLLSSQPLCFNLFGELKAEHGHSLASRVCRHLWPERVDQVTRIEFEYSPGRGDPTYTGNRSAFDVFLEHTVPGGGLGFIGIEMKYHEDLRVEPAENRQGTEKAAKNAGIFKSNLLSSLRRPPLQQLWFDHLLALSMRHTNKEWKTGLFVLLHPSANPMCYRIANQYQEALLSTNTFQRLSLEEVIGALRLHSSAEWITFFYHRYLQYERADRMMAGTP